MGRSPQTTFGELVEIMVEHDLRMVERLVTLRDEGYEVIEQGVNHGE